MAAPVVATTATGVASFADHIDVSIDCTGANGLLLAFTSGIAAGAPAGTPTFNGVAMTSAITPLGVYLQGFGGDTQCWYQIAPTAGAHTLHSANNNAGSNRQVLLAVFLTGAHQTTPLGTVAGTVFYSAGTAFQDVSGTATDDLVIGFHGHIGTGFTEDGGATSLTTGTDNNTPTSRASSLPGTGGTVTMSWTGGAGDPSNVIALAVKAAAASTPTTGTFAGLAIGLGR